MHKLIEALEAPARPVIAVVGDAILDRYVYGSASRLSPEAAVPVIEVERVEESLGGAAAVAHMVAALDSEVYISGLVGNDPDGKLLCRLCDLADVRCSFLVTDRQGRPTTVKERYMAVTAGKPPQQLLRCDREDRTPMRPEMALDFDDKCWPGRASRCDVTLISDYNKGVCSEELVKPLIKRCRDEGKPVIVDPAKGTDWSKYRGATLLKPNRVEASLATGVIINRPEDAFRAAGKLIDTLKVEGVLVTLDKDGMVLLTQDGYCKTIEARPRRIYDITGAGDMVLAALGVGLAKGLPMDEAAVLANHAAGLAVERPGVAILSRRDLILDLAEHAEPPSKAKQPTVAQLADMLARRRRDGKVVFTNGCFDLLHLGHVRLLEEAASLGDCLVVGVNSDESVRRLKGPSRPLQSQEDRCAILAALECVDAVVVFDEDDPLALISGLKPDVLVKGGDYRLDEVVGHELVPETVIVPLVEGRSTTALVASFSGAGVHEEWRD
jgi:D-beta-D-heptose 7-phosphate kinase/D-beta-D-heptose 1-phosphate adenosyltransferase